MRLMEWLGEGGPEVADRPPSERQSQTVFDEATARRSRAGAAGDGDPPGWPSRWAGRAAPGTVGRHRWDATGCRVAMTYPSGWKACSNWRASAWELAHWSTGVMNSTL
jgi:hypothetical protein